MKLTHAQLQLAAGILADQKAKDEAYIQYIKKGPRNENCLEALFSASPHPVAKVAVRTANKAGRKARKET